MHLVKFVKVEKKPTGCYECYSTSTKVKKMYSLNESWINLESIKTIEANEQYEEDLKKGYFPEGLPDITKFSTIYFTDGDVMTVVGSPEDVTKKCMDYPKTLLRG